MKHSLKQADLVAITTLAPHAAETRPPTETPSTAAQPAAESAPTVTPPTVNTDPSAVRA